MQWLLQNIGFPCDSSTVVLQNTGFPYVLQWFFQSLLAEASEELVMNEDFAKLWNDELFELVVMVF